MTENKKSNSETPRASCDTLGDYMCAGSAGPEAGQCQNNMKDNPAPKKIFLEQS